MEDVAQLASPATSSPEANLDPRIRRTREHLQQALAGLLETHHFEALSVQEIAAAARVNRATFYAHYPDKFALLECMVATRFHALLEGRGIVFNGGCTNALRGMVLGVCDYLAQHTASACDTAARHLQPHTESAIIAVVGRMLLDGMQQHIPDTSTSENRMRAATMSWAIFGAAREWINTPQRVTSEEAATTIVALVAPLLAPPTVPPLEPPASA
jgi:AcrR family transcriptional regulator